MSNRRKQVLPANEIPHIWANDRFKQYNTASVRSPTGHVSSAWDSTYNSVVKPNDFVPICYLTSYNTIVASITVDKKGERVVFLTTRRYSVTTGKLMTWAEYAVKGFDAANVFWVDQVVSPTKLDVIKANFHALRTEAWRETLKARTARSNAASHINRAEVLLSRAQKLVHRFINPRINCATTRLKEWSLKKELAANNDPELRTRAERYSFRDVISGWLYHELDDPNLTQFLSSKPEDYVAKFWVEWNKFAANREKQKRLEQIKREQQAELRARWLAGEGVHYYDSDVVLRLHDHHVQTSMGARVGIEDAAKLLKLIFATRYHDNEVEVRDVSIDGYPLRKVNRGTAQVGCHLLKWSAIGDAVVREWKKVLATEHTEFINACAPIRELYTAEVASATASGEVA